MMFMVAGVFSWASAEVNPQKHLGVNNIHEKQGRGSIHKFRPSPFCSKASCYSSAWNLELFSAMWLDPTWCSAAQDTGADRC